MELQCEFSQVDIKRIVKYCGSELGNEWLNNVRTEFNLSWLTKTIRVCYTSLILNFGPERSFGMGNL